MRIFLTISAAAMISLISINALADCPDMNAVLCQNKNQLGERKVLNLKTFGTCWSFSQGCSWCTNGKQEKDHECRQAFGPTFEARNPMKQ